MTEREGPDPIDSLMDRIAGRLDLMRMVRERRGRIRLDVFAAANAEWFELCDLIAGTERIEVPEPDPWVGVDVGRAVATPFGGAA